MKAAEAKGEVSGEGDIESGEVGDVDVGEPAAFADWGCNDTVGGGADGGVGVLVLVAVDALGHLLVVGVWWKRAASGGWCLVEASSFCWLVVGVLVVGSNESCCEIGLGKSLRGFGMFVLFLNS